jgi:hypothetical protein
MGGEYLPDLSQNEVMNASITIASTTQDVTSVESPFYPSTQPLTPRQLEARLALQVRDRRFPSCRPPSRLFRLERLPGGPCTPWKAPPCHGAHPKRTSFRLSETWVTSGLAAKHRQLGREE